MNSDLNLTVAGGAYDRTLAMVDGRVRPRGINLRYLSMPIEEVFYRAFRYEEFDACELSLGYYMTLRALGDDRYIGIPVFPSRFFRHGCIFVPTGSDRTTLDFELPPSSFSDAHGSILYGPLRSMPKC